MKKILLLLLIGAGLWGYFYGPSYFGEKSETTTAVSEKTQSDSDNESIPQFLLDTTVDLFKTLAEGVTTEDAAADHSAPKSTPVAHGENTDASPVHPKTAESLSEEFNDIWEFKTALESRIDRDAFVSSENIPLLMKQAIVAAEDRRFYEHGAVDIMGIGRAAFVNLLSGETEQGGSTIAQQTVKNIFLSEERTFTRKARELALAMQLERYYTKDEILEIYLNTIYFGHGAYGIGQAAHTYFNKKPADLTLSECALLAGLPPAPSIYDPIENPEAGTKRMTIVLMLMAKEGYITPKEASVAAMEVIMK